MDYPRIVIAGAQSGVGKTSVALALTAALRKKGLKVQTFKTGPDFLDPSYLKIASGRPCYNLDGWMSGKDYVCELFVRASKGADISIIEGAMGLFDGADPSTLEGSTAEIACWLEAPVLLVANAHGMARSIAALVKGYATFDPAVNIAGVIANHCGSASHAASLSDSLRAADLPPLIGAIPRKVLPELKSRHLGLVTAHTEGISDEVLDSFAQAANLHCSVDALLKIARGAPSVAGKAHDRLVAEKGIRVGIAFDHAFHFYYQDLFDVMEQYGCELIRFSPITDSNLPKGLDGLFIGGGYPEEYVQELSGNAHMMESVRKFAAAGRPVYAECGGLIYLSQSLELLDGKRYPMVGLLPVNTRMLNKKKTLGYVEVTLKEPSLWGPRRSVFRGHEFHYSELTEKPEKNSDWKSIYFMKRRRSGAIEDEGFQYMSVLAAYAHLHFASKPEAIKHFIARCGGKYEREADSTQCKEW